MKIEEKSCTLAHTYKHPNSPAVLLPLNGVQEELADDVGGAVALGAVLLIHDCLQLLLVPVIHSLLPILAPSPVHSRNVLFKMPPCIQKSRLELLTSIAMSWCKGLFEHGLPISRSQQECVPKLPPYQGQLFLKLLGTSLCSALM